MSILQINASLHGNDGTSSRLADDISTRLGGLLRRRDLSAEPLPHLDAETFAAFGTAPDERSAEQAARVALSDQLIEELREADTLVLAVPMYNFGMPSTLKAWFDQVSRAGVSFRYSSNGPEGLLGEKRVIVVTSRGGNGAGSDSDMLSGHLRQLLAMLGLTAVEFVHAEGLARSGQRDAALAGASEQIERLAA